MLYEVITVRATRRMDPESAKQHSAPPHFSRRGIRGDGWAKSDCAYCPALPLTKAAGPLSAAGPFHALNSVV